MGSKRLENAAQAAGFAMVNPDDFAGEAMQLVAKDSTPEPPRAAQQTAKSWLSWDYLRLTGGKLTA